MKEVVLYGFFTHTVINDITEESIARTAAFLKKQNGFLAVSPQYPIGTVVIFETKNDATAAAEAAVKEGIEASPVTTVYVEKKYYDMCKERKND